METRTLFDLLYSFPVIYSHIVILYERLATFLQQSTLGQVIVMEGRTQCFSVTHNPNRVGDGPGLQVPATFWTRTSIIKYRLSTLIVLKSQKYIAHVSVYIL